MERSAFERKLLDRMEQAIRSEGFTHLQTHLSSKAWTLSAERDGIRVLVHATAGDQAPRATGIADSVKVRDIKLKAMVPAQLLQDPTVLSGPISGVGGSVRRTPKRPATSKISRPAKAPPKQRGKRRG